MDKELDLQHSLRPGLDILGNEIVISLKITYPLDFLLLRTDPFLLMALGFVKRKDLTP